MLQRILTRNIISLLNIPFSFEPVQSKKMNECENFVRVAPLSVETIENVSSYGNFLLKLKGNRNFDSTFLKVSAVEYN